MASLFQNSKQVANYAAFRPTYPKALFDRIAEAAIMTNATKMADAVAADIGCGSGQATHQLARIFGKVTGIDPSESQIEAARREFPGIDFQVGRESKLPFPDRSLSCITSAQAAHWFDLPKFYAEVDRVLQPQGVLAIWCYGMPQFPTALCYSMPSISIFMKRFLVLTGTPGAE